MQYQTKVDFCPNTLDMESKTVNKEFDEDIKL
jgi:hypothetical protein